MMLAVLWLYIGTLVQEYTLIPSSVCAVDYIILNLSLTFNGLTTRRIWGYFVEWTYGNFWESEKIFDYLCNRIIFPPALSMQISTFSKTVHTISIRFCTVTLQSCSCVRNDIKIALSRSCHGIHFAMVSSFLCLEGKLTKHLPSFSTTILKLICPGKALAKTTSQKPSIDVIATICNRKFSLRYFEYVSEVGEHLLHLWLCTYSVSQT